MTTCPSCGVAVVPGYVRCPKCQAGLPMGASRFRRVRRSVDPGGTSMARSSFPVVPVVAAVAVAGAIAAYFALRDDTKPPKLPPPVKANEAEPAVARAPVGGPAPVLRPAPAPTTTAGVDPVAAATELERQLKRQRLWSSVHVNGVRVEIRSGSCSDPLMEQTIDGSRTSLRGGGLTRLRCLAQSGAVVFERDL